MKNVVIISGHLARQTGLIKIFFLPVVKLFAAGYFLSVLYFRSDSYEQRRN